MGVLESLSPRPQVLQGSGATLPIAPNATPGAPSCTLPAPPVVLGTSPCERDGGQAHAPESGMGGGAGAAHAPQPLPRRAPLLAAAASPPPHTISVR